MWVDGYVSVARLPDVREVKGRIAVLHLVYQNWLLAGGHPISSPQPTKSENIVVLPVHRALSKPQQTTTGLRLPTDYA